MTPEERDRLVKIETGFIMLSTSVKSIEYKMDKLIAAANMGRGAFWMLMKLGGALVAVAGLIAWVVEHCEGRS